MYSSTVRKLLAIGTTMTLTAAALTLWSGGAIAAPTPADPGLNPPEWTATQDGPPKYPGVSVENSVPITMPDGVVLRGDVYRPADAAGVPTADQNPVIVNITPYNKLVTTLVDAAISTPTLSPLLLDFINSLNLTGTPLSGLEPLQNMIGGGLPYLFGVDRTLIQSGYTQVVVDARGTGTSQGTWGVFDDLEQSDTPHVLDWARSQPWSDGKLGMSGVSYSAVNQLQVAAKQPQGLDALFAVEPMTDLARDVIAPGGGFGVGFLSLWLALVNSTKFIPDVQSMLRGEFDAKWLQDRLAEPLTYFPELAEALFAPSESALSAGTRELTDPESARRNAYLTDASAITTPTFVVGGWHDLFTNAEWRSLDQLSSLGADKKKLIMGSGFHITPGADMGGENQPPRLDVLQRAWFDKWLKGIDNGIDRYSPATVHQLGGGWVQSGTFPREGQEYRRLYLDATSSGTAGHAVADGSLSSTPPSSFARWTIAPGLSTLCSNDATQASTGMLVILPMCTDDTRLAESNALTFTSAPVAVATDISGPINVHLNTQVDATDGFFAVMVTDVAPDGRSQVISSGSLTTSLRNTLDTAQSGYSANGDLTDPVYTLDLANRALVTPGEVTALDIGTHATDAVLQPGHRLRVDVYAFNFPKAISLGPVSADTGLRPEHVVIDPNSPSWINLPSNVAIG
ncbi:putative CocE/NonD family hydrolase [Rhodococcus sp. 27YEA15]|uniref:CocE/NonD family hydrolase n=1 Tax=Rhodococcus sp. 27YEA15 TaxID=3156259 RepID=UPI003C7AB9B5